MLIYLVVQWISLFLSLREKFSDYFGSKAGMVGAVGKISAFQPQGPQFDPLLCQDLNWFMRLSFPPKLIQLSIPPE